MFCIPDKPYQTEFITLMEISEKIIQDYFAFICDYVENKSAENNINKKALKDNNNKTLFYINANKNDNEDNISKANNSLDLSDSKDSYILDNDIDDFSDEENIHDINKFINNEDTNDDADNKDKVKDKDKDDKSIGNNKDILDNEINNKENKDVISNNSINEESNKAFETLKQKQLGINDNDPNNKNEPYGDGYKHNNYYYIKLSLEQLVFSIKNVPYYGKSYDTALIALSILKNKNLMSFNSDNISKFLDLWKTYRNDLAHDKYNGTSKYELKRFCELLSLSVNEIYEKGCSLRLEKEKHYKDVIDVINNLY